MPFLWAVPLLLAGVAGMQWAAGFLAGRLAALRLRWGLAQTAAGALMGAITALPEISVSIASTVLGWPSVGLGTALGSNVPALPLALFFAWLSLRLGPRQAPDAAFVAPHATSVEALPYLLLLGLLALLTLPAAMRGLEPEDGAILALAYLAFLGQAILRKRVAPRQDGDPGSGLAWKVPLALAALSVGAVAAIYAADAVGKSLGLSELASGLFIIGLLCAIPEAFAAWTLARENRATMAVAGALSDGIASITLALVPLALVGTEVGDAALYALNLGYIAIVLLLYILFSLRPGSQQVSGLQVGVFALSYAAYITGVALLR